MPEINKPTETVSCGVPDNQRWPKYVQNAMLDLQRYMEAKGKRMLHAEFDDTSHLFVHRHEKKP